MNDEAFADLRQAWPRPGEPRPVVFVGAGGIVQSAHVPAYRDAGLPIAGAFDVDPSAARTTVEQSGGRVFATLAEATRIADAVFDVAVPGSQIESVLRELPRGGTVLIQKPMGEDLAAARRIRALCRERDLTAAVNFQLRFSPNLLALADAVRRGLLGELLDLEVRVVVHTPWQRWPFLVGLPRLEVLYHAIHYLDAVRSLAGEPRGVTCRAYRDPRTPELADTRSTIVLDCGDRLRATVHTHHAHTFGRRHAMSALRLEGTRGAAVAKIGVNLDYPRGEPDELELSLTAGAAPTDPGPAPTWQPVPLCGSWFPDAFAGPLCNLQRFAAGEDPELLTRVDDALRTMALVEACYDSNAESGTRRPIP